jgi:hypothetical protein
LHIAATTNETAPNAARAIAIRGRPKLLRRARASSGVTGNVRTVTPSDGPWSAAKVTPLALAGVIGKSLISGNSGPLLTLRT